METNQSQSEEAGDEIMSLGAGPDLSDAGQQLRLVEAMLFASDRPLGLQAMRERLPEGADLGGLLMDIQKTYEGKGVNLIELNGSWAFRTAVDLGDSLLVTRDVQRRMSRAAMETLAIIAYHQPVTRAEIENIRGVATHKGMLDVLIEAGWVKPGRRRETPGRPLTWVTTTAFLDHFGLEAITDLPGLDELKASGLLDRRPAIDALSSMDDLFEGVPDAEASSAEDEDDEEGEFEDDDEFEGDEDEAASESVEDNEEDSEEDGGGEENDDEFEDDEDDEDNEEEEDI